MTDLSEKDKERIVRLGLSPLYISVHSTERALRNRLLGNPRAPDIMGELQWLREHRLRAHTQIVLCPGYNDRQHLERTLEDLYRFYPYVASIAVVPVGLTAHRRGTVPLRPLSVQDARDALRRIQAFQRRWLRRHGEPIVYAADELYIKAGRPLPPLRHYGELPQVENGVGMVALFQHQAQRLRITRAKTRCRFLLFTGASFYPFLKGFVERLKGAGYRVSLVGVQNRFFGPTVTVAGLLTGRDILRSLAEHARGHDILLVPQNALREAGEPCFLDDVHIRELQEALGLKALAVEPSPEAVLEAMKAC
jgi:putative radical SAM enzyme (TIGR03279 family)